MAVSVAIELDEPEKVHRLEGMLKGRTRVRCDEESLGVLEVIFELVTTGVNGPPGAWNFYGRSEVVYDGLWQAGEAKAHEFEVVLPEMPPAYDGGLLSLAWKVYATVTIPETEENVRSNVADVRLASAEGDWTKIETKTEARPEAVEAEVGRAPFIFVAALVVASVAAIAGGFAKGSLVIGIVGAVALALTGGLLIGLLVWSRNLGIYGDVQVGISARPGSPPEHEITLYALPTAPIGRAAFELAVSEMSRWGTSENSSVDRAEVWKTTLELAAGQTPGSYSGVLALPSPDELPIEFDNHYRTIEWRASALVWNDAGGKRAYPVPIHVRFSRRPQGLGQDEGSGPSTS